MEEKDRRREICLIELSSFLALLSLSLLSPFDYREIDFQSTLQALSLNQSKNPEPGQKIAYFFHSRIVIIIVMGMYLTYLLLGKYTKAYIRYS